MPGSDIYFSYSALYEFSEERYMMQASVLDPILMNYSDKIEDFGIVTGSSWGASGYYWYTYNTDVTTK